MLLGFDEVIDRHFVAQALDSMMLVSKTICTKVVNVGVIQHLLKLLSLENEFFVYVEGASAL